MINASARSMLGFPRRLHAAGTTLSLAVILVLAAVTTPSAQAQTFTVLHAFTDAPDGNLPNAIIRDAKGNIYGTTAAGGILGCANDGQAECGTIFEVDTHGNETVLYRFTGFSDGSGPVAAPVQDAAGNLYGTTEGNGATNSPSTVFKLDKSGQLTVLHTFDTGFANGGSADSPLVLDKEGNLYGTAPLGGDDQCGSNGNGCGIVFKVDTKGKFSVIHTFTGPFNGDGWQPEGGLVIDHAGNLYGSTYLGGDRNCGFALGCGVVFKVDTSGKYTLLHRFTRLAEGRYPLGLIQDSAGNLYGWAASAGDLKCDFDGCGTIFEVVTSGKFKVLYTFTQKNYRYRNSGFDVPHLVRDKKGNLYGANQLDGAHNAGYLFELNTKGKFTDLYDFPGADTNDNGFDPQGFVLDQAGNFYGTMAGGGDIDCNIGEHGCGTVFKLTP